MRDLVCTCRGEWPKTSQCPFVGFNKPSSNLTVVDFPEPFGPSNPKTSPRRTSKSTLSTARAFGRPQKSLKTFVRPRTETTTSEFFELSTEACCVDSIAAISVRSFAENFGQIHFRFSLCGYINHRKIEFPWTRLD